MSGSPSTSQPVQMAPPIYPPGYGFAQSFFDQILPQIMGQPFPTFQGNIDPGMSPTAAAAIRGSQQYMETPFSNNFGAAAGSIGKFMNPAFENPRGAGAPGADYGFNYDQSMFAGPPPQMEGAMNMATPGLPTMFKRPGEVPEGHGSVLDSLLSSMQGNKGGPAPPAGGFPAAPMSPAGSMPPLPISSVAPPGPAGPAPSEGPQNIYAKVGSRDPGGGINEGIPQGILGDTGSGGSNPEEPSGPFSRPPSPGPWNMNPDLGSGGSGSGGGAPAGGGGTPGGAAPPAGGGGGFTPPGGWMPWMAGASALFDAVAGRPGGGGGGGVMGRFDPPQGPDLPPLQIPGAGGRPHYTSSYVDYNPGSNVIQMVSGTTTPGSWELPGNVPPGMPPPAGPSPPGGPAPPAGGKGDGGGGQDWLPQPPDTVIGQGNLPWFGRWTGPNKGKSEEEIVFDMWTRGWPMGSDYQPPQHLVDAAREAGQPFEFGSRPTTYGELTPHLYEEWQQGGGATPQASQASKAPPGGAAPVGAPPAPPGGREPVQTQPVGAPVAMPRGSKAPPTGGS